MGGSAVPFVLRAPQPSTLFANAATFDAATGQMVMEYNALLETRTFINFNAWSIRVSNIIRQVTAGRTLGDKCILTTTTSVADPGPNIVDYAPPPNNVRRYPDGLFAIAQTLTPTVVP